MSRREITTRRRSGFALIDAVLSLAILAIAAAGMIALLRQTALAVEFATSRDREARSAGLDLAGLSVRDATWFDQRLGSSRYQSWTLQVDRISPALYHASLSDTVTGKARVETTFYHRLEKDTSAQAR